VEEKRKWSARVCISWSKMDQTSAEASNREF
jgi:hypothetical protein